MSEYNVLREEQRQNIMNQYKHLSDENSELSMTLMERRRRLHDLAVEINQWEDQEPNVVKK
jgi:hypothetical protein